VAVRRWEQATGKEAVLDGSALTFAQVAAERGGDGGEPGNDDHADGDRAERASQPKRRKPRKKEAAP
jgi:hypothetical protein